MSEHLDRLEELLNKALPLPDCIDVVCLYCPPPPLDLAHLVIHGQSPKHLAHLDTAGDTSPRGLYPYACDGCGGRFSLGGKSAPKG